MFNRTKKTARKISDTGKQLLSWDTIVKSSRDIKEMSKQVLSPTQQIENAKVEKFEDAVQRLKLSDIDILKVYRNYVICFYLSVLFFISGMAGLFYAIYAQGEVIHILVIFSILFFIFTNIFKFSFRSYQIRYRKLYPVSKWWKESQFWFPPLNYKEIKDV